MARPPDPPREPGTTPPPNAPEAHDPHRGPAVYPASKARQGHIVLRTPTRRALFLGGLIAAAVIALLAGILRAL